MTASRNKEHAAILRQLTAFPQLRAALGVDVVAALELINLDYNAFNGVALAQEPPAFAAAKGEWGLLARQHQATATTFAQLRRIVQEAGINILGALVSFLAHGTPPAVDVARVLADAVTRMTALLDGAALDSDAALADG
jgi:hypothetical protein